LKEQIVDEANRSGTMNLPIRLLIDTCQQGRAAIAMFGAVIAEFASKELA
jgi:hypothetical protein